MAKSSKPHITKPQLKRYQGAFEKDSRHRAALNAVTKTSVSKVALNRRVVTGLDHTYSVMLKSNETTEQKSSGRCWLFAGLNLFRNEAIKHLNVKNFEFSQSYQMFWDKLEKSNYFLESILATPEEPVNGRLIMHLLRSPIQDGGQWDMFANLVRKYGVVPKVVMPETESSSNTRLMNSLITAKLRENAAELRRQHAGGAGEAELRRLKDEQIGIIYRMLCIHLGEPPTRFHWQWRNKDDKFHRAGEITPREFFRRYVRYDLDKMVCLINCPTSDKPFEKLYTIEYLGNVVEGEIIRYLNVDLSIFKQAAVKMLQAGIPVWFGCDVGKMMERDLGILDVATYDYPLLYGAEFTADKAERVDYGQSVMTHAMVFTGVDLDEDGNPRKWRVENSWGEKYGDKGFMVMTDAWFDEYMYEVAVEKRFLPKKLLPVLDTEPVKLPPWDPMGALARATVVPTRRGGSDIATEASRETPSTKGAGYDGGCKM